MHELFLLDPDVVYLDHGAFGACPRPVFELYQRLQLELERQPVAFLARERGFAERFDAAKARLAAEVGANPANLVFVPNATSALNVVARSLGLRPGDGLVTSDQEYGAVDVLWRFACAKAGARYVRCPLPLPPENPEQVLDALWSAVTDRTRAVVVSHITSPTGLRMPVEEICRRARDAGILAIVDGAHAPGQLDLDLERLGADLYAGNCHKWLCAPKGAGFLYARPEHHSWLEPLVVSWDWEGEGGFSSRHRWGGTRDPAAFLAVPAAIDFQQEHGWDEVRARCHRLADVARCAIAELFALDPIAPDPSWFVQMVAAPIPDCDARAVQHQLRSEHSVEVPVRRHGDRVLIRVSVQGYNDEGDLERLLEALEAVVPR